jgi:hypothetical protein
MDRISKLPRDFGASAGASLYIRISGSSGTQVPLAVEPDIGSWCTSLINLEVTVVLISRIPVFLSPEFQ